MKTRLTQEYNLSHPIVLAPMGGVSGGKLAAAVANAGGFGFIGGGYGSLDFIRSEYSLALDKLDQPSTLSRLGVGFITWKLHENREALSHILTHHHRPRAVFLSFGNIEPYVQQIKEAGCVLWSQVQTLTEVKKSCEAGADVIVVQGGSGGGHGLISSHSRSTITLVPEAADWLSHNYPHVSLVAAGGIADARGVAASLCLGASAALLGTAFWLTEESLAVMEAKKYACSIDGDSTYQSDVLDIVRGYDWPKEYSIRTYYSPLIQQWQDKISELHEQQPHVKAQYLQEIADGDPRSLLIIGQAIGLLDAIKPAHKLLEDISQELDSICVRNYSQL